jgi:16S rRNA (cytosine967-C5)-methyltransferase
VVLIDAPCTGSGAWRRNPDAKWRVRPGALEQRIKDQNEILERAARYVKPGGHLVYVTCSLLKAENEDRIAAFLTAHDAFLPLEAAHWASACSLPALATQASSLGVGFRFSPLRTATDGFYVAPLTRSA